MTCRRGLPANARPPLPLSTLLCAAVVAAAARGTAYLPATGVAFVHLLAYASWLGSIVWSELGCC